MIEAQRGDASAGRHDVASCACEGGTSGGGGEHYYLAQRDYLAQREEGEVGGRRVEEIMREKRGGRGRGRNGTSKVRARWE